MVWGEQFGQRQCVRIEFPGVTGLGGANKKSLEDLDEPVTVRVAGPTPELSHKAAQRLTALLDHPTR